MYDNAKNIFMTLGNLPDITLDHNKIKKQVKIPILEITKVAKCGSEDNSGIHLSGWQSNHGQNLDIAPFAASV